MRGKPGGVCCEDRELKEKVFTQRAQRREEKADSSLRSE
jgi:hypothetical protein